MDTKNSLKEHLSQVAEKPKVPNPNKTDEKQTKAGPTKDKNRPIRKN